MSYKKSARKMIFLDSSAKPHTCRHLKPIYRQQIAIKRFKHPNILGQVIWMCSDRLDQSSSYTMAAVVDHQSKENCFYVARSALG